MNPRIVVVTPTYNERENLPELVRRIFLLRIPNLRMIVVDDNSPDGTGALALRLARQYPITVLRREKKLGLGTAYVCAFKKILSDPNRPDLIVQLDADLSHNPSAIPELIAASQNCDLVLGSRYVPGGRVENWDWKRRFVSRFGNAYARALLGLPYRDLTGGFKCYKRNTLGIINLESLSSAGYNFQIETTYSAHKKGLKICEVPIVFSERVAGKSKFNLSIMIESFLKVLFMRFHD